MQDFIFDSPGLKTREVDNTKYYKASRTRNGSARQTISSKPTPPTPPPTYIYRSDTTLVTSDSTLFTSDMY